VWYHLALARLALGDRLGYRWACAGMRSRFGRAADGNTANLVAWTCALADSAAPDLSDVVGLARQASAGGDDANVLNTLGAILVRAGQHTEAVEVLKRAVALQGGGGTAMDWFYLALAHRRLGDGSEAAKALKLGKEKATAAPPTAWHDKLELELLLRELGDK
jgi:hypothetical protein